MPRLTVVGVRRRWAWGAFVGEEPQRHGQALEFAEPSSGFGLCLATHEVGFEFVAQLSQWTLCGPTTTGST